MSDLSKSQGQSHIWIRNQIDRLDVIPNFTSTPARKIRLVCDATYFGKIKDRTEMD